MTDLMGWLYDHYIHPQIENQPQDDADELHFAILESALMEVKFGLALGEDLREI